LALPKLAEAQTAKQSEHGHNDNIATGNSK
jgi:hypothetical protein